ncbi:MAG: pyridoxamine 5'-phosphate oxidase family protein [Deltaproteobacteria bacterium]|jgi:nitroimidazol reductase NimA-like FMN-containing flavoprotein (pyridoxamine 5'-phosphate oxidase superfamily)|nr:pyridoxamine 5'-phosphate oxidase family protein [Deltaproteobacteria bacterium]
MTAMRRKDRAISESETRELLHKAEYGILSTVSGDGQPYGVPLNFCVIEDCLYFHHAVEGHLVENITGNPHVSFCVVGDTELMPEKFGTLYESVILFGNIEEVFDAQKQAGLEGLVAKYSPDFTEEGREYIEKLRDRTRVFKIKITDISGKARRE